MSLSRRNAIASAGILALGLVAAPLAWGDEGAEAQLLEGAFVEAVKGLTDDELLELESLVLTEKSERGIEMAPFPLGFYKVGVDIAPGSYVITAVCSSDDGGLHIETSSESGESENEINLSLRGGGQCRIVLQEGDTVYAKGLGAEPCICTIAPGKQISFQA